MKKPFWQSSTLWINAAGVAVIALEMASVIPRLEPEYVALIVAVLNILNRFRVNPAEPPKKIALS